MPFPAVAKGQQRSHTCPAVHTCMSTCRISEIYCLCQPNILQCKLTLIYIYIYIYFFFLWGGGGGGGKFTPHTIDKDNLFLVSGILQFRLDPWIGLGYPGL